MGWLDAKSLKNIIHKVCVAGSLVALVLVLGVGEEISRESGRLLSVRGDGVEEVTHGGELHLKWMVSDTEISHTEK